MIDILDLIIFYYFYFLMFLLTDFPRFLCKYDERRALSISLFPFPSRGNISDETSLTIPWRRPSPGPKFSPHVYILQNARNASTPFPLLDESGAPFFSFPVGLLVR